jgi:hypothetical protein
MASPEEPAGRCPACPKAHDPDQMPLRRRFKAHPAAQVVLPGQAVEQRPTREPEHGQPEQAQDHVPRIALGHGHVGQVPDHLDDPRRQIAKRHHHAAEHALHHGPPRHQRRRERGCHEEQADDQGKERWAGQKSAQDGSSAAGRVLA